MATSREFSSGSTFSLPASDGRVNVRVFVDVGAHYGETLEIALNPVWGFNRIFALEPASDCQSLLRKFRDQRLIVHSVGLASRTSTATLYGAGLLGGSIFKSKRQKTNSKEVKTELIQLVRASEWFEANIPPEAEIFLKFNCEGAECDIIEDLLSAGLGPRLTSLYIDFDIRKVEGLKHRQAAVERRLNEHGVRYVSAQRIGCGTKAITDWLTTECPQSAPRWIDAARYRIGSHAPLYVRFTSIARLLFPLRLYWWLGHRFGRLARSRLKRKISLWPGPSKNSKWPSR